MVIFKKSSAFSQVDIEKAHLRLATLNDSILVEAIEYLPPPFLTGYQSSPFQHIQMVRNGRLRNVEELADIGNAELPFLQQLQDS